MHSIEIDCFHRQLKTILSEPSSILVHQSSETWLDTSITFANFLEEKRTMHCMFPIGKEYRTFVMCSLCDVALYVKKNETVFYNITYKPTVTHILKTLLEHNFHDVEILII